jgi:hypothetical protein
MVEKCVDDAACGLCCNPKPPCTSYIHSESQIVVSIHSCYSWSQVKSECVGIDIGL